MEWRNIIGFDNYQVSESGDVKSIDHFSEYECNGKMIKRLQKGKTLAKGIHGTGYIVYVLMSNENKKTLRAHRIVAKAFIKNENSLKNVVNHKDGNKHNNHYSNLEWVTMQENNIHAYETNLKQGKNIALSVLSKTNLTIEDIRFIRSNYKAYDPKFGAKPMAEKFKTTKSTISEIANYKRYSSII